jgi:hypothetical protein
MPRRLVVLLRPVLVSLKFDCPNPLANGHVPVLYGKMMMKKEGFDHSLPLIWIFFTNGSSFGNLINRW